MIRLIALLTLIAGPAAAQDASRYYPPEGCTGVVTVQTRGCIVNNIYTCAADQPGDSWRLMFNQDGPVFLSKIDYETQWLESYDLFPTRRETLRQPAPDPASLTELLETGIDTFDFTQTSQQRVTRVVGFDRLTGEDVVIDGEPLLGTEFSVRYEDSTGRDLQVRGREFVSVKHRRFISGVTTLTRGDEVEERDRTPVEFIYPGEPGFFSQTPLYECEASLARFVPITKGSDQ
ncbi:hypothetical protein [uncultured Tateyamaria sp.]|uniref:hypothetical protein n=1 Tax=Tateyamaria sp. TaxID=1929288 RepID=UPI002608505D|nr:hypothetical protein [uncultured Tateyamaria sp.]